MRKEIVIAILLGTFFGAILAFGIWRANFAFKEKVDDSSKTDEQQVQDISSHEFKIGLTSPEENDVITKSPVKISGITKSQNWLVISSGDEDIVVKTDDNGTFEEEVEAEGSVNQLILYSFEEDGSYSEKLLTFVYSTEFEKYLDSKEEENESNEDSIKEKVSRKVESTRKNSKAFIGTLTDITEDTFQIKNLADEILQISLSDEVDYLSINKTSKSIDFEDVAIGDFIVAMGFVNGDEVLEAKRVLITEPLEKPTRKIVFGSVNKIEGKNLELVAKDKETYFLNFPKRWKGPEIKELEEEMKVIVVYEPDEENLTIRTIEIISESKSSPTPTQEKFE